jgi:hypothetical protein
MSGLPKQKQYQYSAEGKFLREFDSLTEVIKQYNFTKGNFYGGKDYKLMSDGTYISHYRIGREKLKKQIRINNCKYCNVEYSTSKGIEVYNLKNEKIAEFRNLAIAIKLTNISASTIVHSASRNSKGCHTTNNLTFKYKK